MEKAIGKRVILMNGEVQEIIDKFLAFSNYLSSINLEDWKSRFSENELRELNGIINGIQLHLINFDENDKKTMVVEMKSEVKPPENVSINHFPVIKRADFLTDKERKVVDNYFWILRKGETITRLPKIVEGNQEKLIQLEQFLITNEIAKRYYLVVCPFCKDGYLSKPLSEAEKEELDEILKKPKTEERSQSLSDILIYPCMKCEDQMDMDTIQSLEYKPILKMVGEHKKVEVKMMVG